MSEYDKSPSADDRVRAGLEAFILGLTPNPGTGPPVEQFISEYPEVGIVRSVNDMIEADSEARKQGNEISEQAEKAESADESDPPDGFLDGLRDLSIEWESPFIESIDRDDREAGESEFDNTDETE